MFVKQNRSFLLQQHHHHAIHTNHHPLEMRNEHLDLAHPHGSSGSESSPSWASTTPKTPEFTFDFAQCQTIDDLTSQLKSTLRSSRSSDVLSENSGEDKSTPSSSGRQFLYPKTSKKFLHFGSGEQMHINSTNSSFSEVEKKPIKGESKIAKFLRRTQSANEDHCSTSAPSSSTTKKSGGSVRDSSREKDTPPTHCQKSDDTVAEELRNKRRSRLGTDMKFRLGFLKRRHTEGTIHSTSVRPHPEEAQKWTNSFHDLMASKYGQALFRAFLQREFSDENIEFWLTIEDYRKTRPNKLPVKAQKIYNDFIVPQAPKEVNLDSLTREGLVSKMLTPNSTTFDQAQKRIQGLLEGDAYIRFLKSDLYMELLHPEKYQS